MEAARDALRELRSIQDQRIADEQAGIERARAAAEAVRIDGERAEQARRDAERLRREEADRAHALAIARVEAEARSKAERELAIVRAEADARARVEMELAATRHAIELRPGPEIPRSRVAWVLGFALALACVALGLGATIVVDRGDGLKARTAELAAANHRLDELGTRIASIESKLGAADQRVIVKQHELDTANAEIERLRAAAAPTAAQPASPKHVHTSPRAPAPPERHQPLILKPGCTSEGSLGCMPRDGHN